MKIRKKIVCACIIICLMLSLLCGCSGSLDTEKEIQQADLGNGWVPVSEMELLYAHNFRVDYYSGGYALISISDGSRFLVVPEDQETPADIETDIKILKQPIDHIYLAATSAMCLFDALDALGSISMSGTQADGWYVENAKEAMLSGDIVYAGKYSKPDYELILAKGCRLAIESTMISHAPQVKEKLEELGVPVLVEQSSYEAHPLGRTEWIKLYAVITDKTDEAESIFDQQVAYMDSVAELENTGKTVAFFYISSSGQVITRKSGDYVTKMIALAGGRYIFDDIGDPEISTSKVILEMEEFYATAKDVDFIIYNSTIDGGVYSIAELIGKNALLEDFKAVKNGNVWCTGKNLYQETTQVGLMIADMHRMLVLGSELSELNYMFKLK